MACRVCSGQVHELCRKPLRGSRAPADQLCCMLSFHRTLWHAPGLQLSLHLVRAPPARVSCR